MPKFTVEHKSSHSADIAYKKIKDFLSQEDELQKFDSKLRCHFDDSALSCKMSGAQFNAQLAIAAMSNGSTVSIIVDLPLMLSPFKGKVTETLQRKLAKYLA